MHTRRSGGEMTLAALSNAERGSLKNHVNDAQDSEALARSGPIGLFCAAGRKRLL